MNGQRVREAALALMLALVALAVLCGYSHGQNTVLRVGFGFSGVDRHAVHYEYSAYFDDGSISGSPDSIQEDPFDIDSFAGS